jgi:hypothetical protein
MTDDASRTIRTETIHGDLVEVVDKTALIENVINQVIVGFCKPRREAGEFMWNVVLDTSVISLGAKVKVTLAIAHELQYELDKNALHRVVALRNAFAHHATDAFPVLSVGKSQSEDRQYNMLWILEGTGKVARLKRHEALEDFRKFYRKAKQSLVGLMRVVIDRYGSDA